MNRLRGQLGLNLVCVLGLEGAKLCLDERFRPKVGFEIGRRFSYLS